MSDTPAISDDTIREWREASDRHVGRLNTGNYWFASDRIVALCDALLAERARPTWVASDEDSRRLVDEARQAASLAPSADAPEGYAPSMPHPANANDVARLVEAARTLLTEQMPCGIDSYEDEVEGWDDRVDFLRAALAPFDEDSATMEADR